MAKLQADNAGLQHKVARGSTRSPEITRDHSRGAERSRDDPSLTDEQVAREHEIRVAAQGEKLRLEREIEMDSERHFNSCSSRSSLSLPGSPSVAASAPTMPYPNLHLPPGVYT